MNYQHSYHAGNFSEVIKHIVLMQLLVALQKKDGGICVIDSHAGAGLYDLGGIEAQKTLEYCNGIGAIQKNKMHAPPCLVDYFKQTDPFFYQKTPHYPGSPTIVRAMLREQDYLIVNEKLPKSFEQLQSYFLRDKKVALHHRNAYEFLPAMLPPKNYRRGLVFIDPPFERTDERENLIGVLEKSLARFAQGVYAVWYPLTDREPRFEPNHTLKKIGIPEKTLWFEFCVHDPDTKGLIGCAMLIINFPWQFDRLLEAILPDLWERLSLEKKGFYQMGLF